MKSIFAAALLAVSALAPLPAAAATLDISTLKCSDIADMKPDELALVLAWIDGYLGGQADDTRLDLDRFSANADAADKACAEAPETGLLTVLKQADSQN